MNKYAIIAALLLLSDGDLVAAEQAQNAKCEMRDQIVPTAKAAGDIYKAVLDSRHGRILSGNFIKVSDDGDHWSVFQYPKHVPPPKRNIDGSTSVTVVTGGGTATMTINKCDGSMSYFYSR